MWNTVLGINSILLTLSIAYLVYTLGAAILTGAWGHFWLAVLILAILIIAEIVFAMLND